MPILKGTNSTVSEVLKPAPGDDRFGEGTTSGHKISDPLSYDRAECQVLEHETEPQSPVWGSAADRRAALHTRRSGRFRISQQLPVRGLG